MSSLSRKTWAAGEALGSSHRRDHNALEHAVPSAGFLPLMDVTVSARGSDPRPREFFSDYLWGEDGTNIYRSDDAGASWSSFVAGPGAGAVRRIIPRADGEVLVLHGQIYKSLGWASGSPTFTQVLDPVNGTAGTLEWGFDGDGTKFIVTHYSSVDRADSRYAWISTDQGDTWTQVWDANALFVDGADTHQHAVCYDSWDDKFYLCEGHGSGVGVYVSSDNGDNWTKVADPDGLVGTSSPTVAVATDLGIVFGTDNLNDGLWVLRRGSSNLEQAWRWNAGKLVLNGFAMQGTRDAETGVVYVGFRSDHADVGAVITASDGQTASLVWTDPSFEGEWRPGAVTDGGVLAGSNARDDKVVYATVGKRGVPYNNDPGNVFGGEAANNQTVAVGQGAEAVDRGVAVGSLSVQTPATPSTDVRMVTIGAEATATRVGGIAVGFQAEADGAPYGVAVGYQADAGNTDAVAIGRAANAAGNDGVALGAGASTSTWLRSVALGADTTVSANDQVMVGGRDVEITDAAKGVVLRSPDGTRWRITVDNSGNLSTTSL